MLNSKGEVCDVLDVSQFIPGRSAYECVAYSAALIYYAGLPGHGATGTTLQASNLAQFWYGKEEGSNLSSNTNGMSVAAMHNMLDGMGLKYQPLVENIGTVRSTLEQDGLPVMLCGAETGMHDVALGDQVPYSWTPTGNHCIVVSGVDPATGNFLVHDCASISSSGVRPGPRVYDASKLQIVSATAVHLREESIVIEYNTPGIKPYYTETDAQHWTCLQTGKIVQFAILDAYKRYGNSGLNGLTFLGLPLSNEMAIEHIQPKDNPTKYAHLAGNGIVVQAFERGDLVYDPKHLLDSVPEMSGSVYPAHINDGVGLDALIAIQKVPMPPPPPPTIQGIDPNHVKNFQQALELQAHDLVAKAQALESAIIVPVQ